MLFVGCRIKTEEQSQFLTLSGNWNAFHTLLQEKTPTDVMKTQPEHNHNSVLLTTARRQVSTCGRALWHDASPFPSLMKTCRWKMVYLGLYITYQWQLELPWEDKNENLNWPCGNVHGVRKTDRIVKGHFPGWNNLSKHRSPALYYIWLSLSSSSLLPTAEHVWLLQTSLWGCTWSFKGTMSNSPKSSQLKIWKIPRVWPRSM